MDSQDRHSEALEVELITDPEQKAIKEAENVLRQFNTAIEQIEYSLQPQHPFKLRASSILTLNRIALEGLSRYAGNYRPNVVEIVGSKHRPPNAHLVPEYVEDLCDYVNGNWGRSPIHLASYVLWRLNWIHPFVDGNGRTARVVSFVVLCVKLGYRVPGSNTVPEQISHDKEPYYGALEQADTAYEKNQEIDVTAMEGLVDKLLVTQLAAVIRDARAGQPRQIE
jgi:Fic family protein